MFIMDYFGRQNFSQLYGGKFSPYWLPRRYFQPDRQPVLVVQVPVTWRNNFLTMTTSNQRVELKDTEILNGDKLS